MSTALANAPSRRIFAPMFRARWQNMQNIVNNSVFMSLVPEGYKTYYYAYINQWDEWARGFVLQLHSSDFFSTGMGYTVCDIMTRECMSGGFRLQSGDAETKAFMEAWADRDLNNILNRMFFHANAVGNAVLVLTPVDGELCPAVYPVTRCFFQIGRTGRISQISILNRFVAGDVTYYARECRVMREGKPYYKVSLAEGTLVTSPTWHGRGLTRVPEKIRTQWEYCYGSIRPGTWYRMPEGMRNIGCYNVRNKSVAVALSDMPGYTDSTLHTALDILYSIDYNYTQAQVDQYMGKSRALIPRQFSGVRVANQPGTLADGLSFREALEVQTNPIDDTFYTQIPDNNLNGDAIKPMFIQPDLRAEPHRYIRDSDLEMLASKVGLSSSTLANHLAYNSSGTKTDDEVSSENSTTEKTVGNKRALAGAAINEMLRDVAHFYGKAEDVDIQWGRSAANSARENAELLADYQAGTLPLRDYLRRRWADLTEDDVERMATELEQKAERERMVGFDGASDYGDYFGTGGVTDGTTDAKTAGSAGADADGRGDGDPKGGA